MKDVILQELSSLLEQYGITHAVCSPGSRNAALLSALHLNDTIRKHVVIDERVAAFVALGISIAARKPVALVCTSGSAVLNYAPAISEAYYQGIPLIIISADRPKEWIDQDDSQTIRQPGVLSNIVKKSYDINADASSEDYLWYTNRVLNEGLSEALSHKQGPVHFNIHLDGSNNLKEPEFSQARKINLLLPPPRLDISTLNHLVDIAADLKIMVVAGFMQPSNKMQKAVNILNNLPNVVVLAETVSNLHLPSECYRIDNVLFQEYNFKDAGLKPDLVISIGGALISRKLKEFLRNAKVKYHWNVGYNEHIVDCFRSLTTRVEADPATFMLAFSKRMQKKLLKVTKTSSHSFNEKWLSVRTSAKSSFSKIPWSDLKALHSVFNNIPRDCNLFLSNGTVVRYNQIIPYLPPHATYANRGVSGIEGCSSTALGASLIYNKKTLLVTGDMSFIYDIGALASRMARPNFLVIVIDNAGGDIFRFIPATHSLPIREKYLCVNPDIPFKELAEAFGFEYRYADSFESLSEQIKRFFNLSSPRPKILHIQTAKKTHNSEILRKFLNNVYLDNN